MPVSACRFGDQSTLRHYPASLDYGRLHRTEDFVCLAVALITDAVVDTKLRSAEVGGSIGHVSSPLFGSDRCIGRAGRAVLESPCRRSCGDGPRAGVPYPTFRQAHVFAGTL